MNQTILNRLRSIKISGRSKAFSSSSAAVPLGDVLIREGVLTEEKLQLVLKEQERLKEQGYSPRQLGELVVSMGLATEVEVLGAINRFYRISAHNLAGNFADLIQRKEQIRGRGTSVFHPPIKVKLAIAVFVIVGLTIASISSLILRRQQEQLYQQTVRMGKVSLSYFANNAKLHLIEDNVLQLNALIKEASSVSGLLYSVIVDGKGVIKAHSDTKLIGTPFKGFGNVQESAEKDSISYFRYKDEKGSLILNVSRRIEFRGKNLGEVHVGISIDFIQEQIRRERTFILIVGFIIVALGIIAAVLFGITFSRPIGKLVSATKEIARGNYDFKVEEKRRDELGTLGRAFNYMSDELKMKSLLQETFGRYVSPTILKMILADPEKSWLKGMRTEATILFTDIRGFTAFSEKTEPEKIVEDLNEYFAIATQCILDHGGYVDKFIGDAVLGVFGAPAPMKDHAHRSIQACISMQQQFLQAATNGNPLLSRIGIGVNAGIIVAGNLGSQVKMEYSVIGDPVNLASRLNSLAGGGEIIISKSVYDAVKDSVSVETLPLQRVKGKSEEIQVFRVILPQA
ncbi:MAG: HAMP domain-containing protein [Deltaproteobacteria bacterium]|nr:HAMP domain-containing protein [Deltaproteobacteria bacterium]